MADEWLSEQAEGRLMVSLLGRRGILVYAVVWQLLAATPAIAQLGGTLPPPSYEVAKQTLYRGNLRRAERAFTSELRGAVKTIQSRWIDSICFHAMLGETCYQQGRNADALAQFDQACQIFLAYPDWMKRVRFQQNPRPAANNARRLAPWGPSARQVAYASLPETMLMSYGRIDNSVQAEQGGLVQTAQFWKVRVTEIVRCTALAMRRRTQLLGPLSPTDRISKELADTLARGGLGPANHWSNSWNELLHGLSLIGINKDTQAVPHLQRAILLDGRYDHTLTGAALLAQAGIAQRAGNARAAASLYAEASIAAFAFEDLDTVGMAIAQGHLVHFTSGGQGPFAPLVNALPWADRTNLDLLYWQFRNAMTEQVMAAREYSDASKLLAGGGARQRDLAAGRHGSARDWLAARVLVAQGEMDEGREALSAAIGRAASVSLPLFQTELANARFDSGSLSPRLAVDVYRTLLSDPSPMSWVQQPQDTIAQLLANQQPAYDRWLAASVARREVPQAIEISDLAKRRRFFRSQPLGGRLLAMRRFLQAKPEALEKSERLQQQACLSAYPNYAALAAELEALSQAIRNLPEVFLDDRLTVEAAKRFEALKKGIPQREAMLLNLATERLPSPMSFPPIRSLETVQAELQDGEAILLFHEVAGSMQGFLVVSQGEHTWQLGTTRKLTAAVATALRELGLYNRGRAMPASEAASDQWQNAMRELGELVLRDSRLDLSKVNSITVVPDGPLWHLPFEALIAPGASSSEPLIGVAPVRYAPTVGLAVGDTRPIRPVKRTGIAAAKPSGSAADREAAADRLAQLSAQLGGADILPTPLPAPSPLVAAAFDQLVVDLENELSGDSVANWAPLPADRNRRRGQLADWQRLATAPQRLVLAGVRTAAESGLKGGRRASTGGTPGEELFHAACGLLAAGPRTVLLSRWVTGGALHDELVREYASQMDQRPASEAWRRSVLLARDSGLDPYLEPRLAWSDRDGSPPLASHPFFWSGYLLIDTGTDPRPPAIEPAAPMAQEQADQPSAATAHPSPK